MHIMYYKADHKYKYSTRTVMCRYFAFKGAPTVTEMCRYFAFELH